MTVAASKLSLKLSTRASGAAILGDAAQLAAEMIASSVDKEKAKARRIGLGTGAATSGGIKKMKRLLTNALPSEFQCAS